MNILNEVMSAGGGAIVKQLGKQFGLNQGMTEMAIKGLLPAITRGISKQNDAGGLGSIFEKLGQNNINSYVDSPDVFGSPQAKANGDMILGDIFGSKDISRTVAKTASESGGLDYSMMKKMLPMVAGIAFAVLNKKNQSSGGGLLGSVVQGALGGSRGGGGLLGSLLSGVLGGGRRRQQQTGLSSFLDFDGDGSIADDVWNVARKLL